MQIYSNKVFKNPIKVIEAFDTTSFKVAFDEIEKLKNEFYLLGYIRYEAKDIFSGKDIKSSVPLLYFEVFEDYESYSPPLNNSQHYFNLIGKVDFFEYSNALKKIKEYISVGDTYQVNYTYDYSLSTNLSPIELYEAILANQKTPYNAFIKNEYEEVLSFSPELFFEIKNNTIKTKPMKGTVKRGRSEQEDISNIEFLKNDIKNRAENVMIVDLLRNDLGKIANTGSVSVDKLFEIETHKTVHQMTSEVSAKLPDIVTLYDVFNAIFPCGSITGAPKCRTMEIIDELEKGERHIYCGAVGLISKDETIFSVPIRILQKIKEESAYRLRVGGAIVWDSDILDEWEETKTKIKFMNNVESFDLVETINVENMVPVDYVEHIDRMKKSAEYFGFKFNDNLFSISPEQNGIMRILLSRNGEYKIEYKELNLSQTINVAISDIVVDSNNPYLKHKTTFRPWYKNALEKIVKNELYDELFFNEKGELTEGSRTNILLEIDSKLYTPPTSSGLLNGIKRSQLLKEKNCEEKILKLEDLYKAENIYCINSVRGVQKVELV